MDEHKIYTGQLHRGNALYPFGKCRCGAVLMSTEEIEEHMKLEKA